MRAVPKSYLKNYFYGNDGRKMNLVIVTSCPDRESPLCMGLSVLGIPIFMGMTEYMK